MTRNVPVLEKKKRYSCPSKSSWAVVTKRRQWKKKSIGASLEGNLWQEGATQTGGDPLGYQMIVTGMRTYCKEEAAGLQRYPSLCLIFEQLCPPLNRRFPQTAPSPSSHFLILCLFESKLAWIDPPACSVSTSISQHHIGSYTCDQTEIKEVVSPELLRYLTALPSFCRF